MGPNKFIHLTFAVGILLAAFLLFKAGDWVWSYFAKPNELLLQGVGLAIAVVAGVVAYRNERIYAVVVDVTRELAASNRQLEMLSRQDGLTGLSNRRYFDSFLSTEVRRGARARCPLPRPARISGRRWNACSTCRRRRNLPPGCCSASARPE